jgi:hypothetical protein
MVSKGRKRLKYAFLVKVFKCAWFVEKDYFEFFPLQAVRVKNAQAPV